MNQTLEYLKKSADIISEEINEGFKEAFRRRFKPSMLKAIKEKEILGRWINPIAFELGFEAGFQTALTYLMGVKKCKKSTL